MGWAFTMTASSSITPHREMASTGPDLCLAFVRDDSRGASGCADAAQTAGIPVRRYEQHTGTVPCRDPWCRGACGFDVDAHIKTHGPGILVTAKAPADRIVNRTRAPVAPPAAYVRAGTPTGGTCGCPGCEDPYTTVCVFGGRRDPGVHTLHPRAAPPSVAPIPPGDDPTMSTSPTPVDKPTEAPPDALPVVAAEPGSRLESLLAEYERLKPLVDAAAAQLKTITDGIKTEATTAAPDTPKVDITSPVLAAPLRLQAKTSWRLDTRRMKAENPLLYVTYAYESTAWELRAVSATAAS
jgi:hypothetical protein